jgi:hypothetical protein
MVAVSRDPVGIDVVSSGRLRKRFTHSPHRLLLITATTLQETVMVHRSTLQSLIDPKQHLNMDSAATMDRQFSFPRQLYAREAAQWIAEIVFFTQSDRDSTLPTRFDSSWELGFGHS